ncbi:hypothetical protein [Paenibacillus sp. FSL R5-0345]|uniref:hypothetical protein n=1 Tax=unclassified Paenibacillus TaxID=185978 RepID=UPI0004F863C1|nr:hypothetical protein [Paenibacillus sp. FSL R5-0345]AIQ34042.1 hypothetical protein R50345_04915 [Paenibacillus sp. FSL R5-0345]
MHEAQMIQERLNQLNESVNELTDNVLSIVSYTDERLKAIEKLMWKIESKLVDQTTILNLLSENELIDQLVTRKYHMDRVIPFHLMSQKDRLETIEAMNDEL